MHCFRVAMTIYFLLFQGCYDAMIGWLADNVTIVVGVIFGIILIEVRGESAFEIFTSVF